MSSVHVHNNNREDTSQVRGQKLNTELTDTALRS